jgi:hypothetical protein
MTKPRITLPNTEYDRGFENGALGSFDATLAWLRRTGRTAIADEAKAAWEDDTLVERSRPLPDLSEVP